MTAGPDRPHTFFCIDGHTCGNPVRLVAGGGPQLAGRTMSERRQDFLANHDWVRRALMFEPRGHDIMSGSILYPPLAEGCDVGVLFIETSGCLPMCGHGTIGTVTFALEHGLVRPRDENRLALDTPAGVVTAEVRREGPYVTEVRITNVLSYLALTDVRVDCPELGELVVDIAYGGNFYAIVESQPNFRDLAEIGAGTILRLSGALRRRINQAVTVTHPEDPTIQGVSHIMWTGKPTTGGAHARNAVFYGDKAIDRSPCGTGTSARMAQLAGRGRLKVGDDFVHESIIGSRFHGRVESAAMLGNVAAIRPSVAGWARVTGHNTILVDPRDPFATGFQVV
ncbi:MAG: 4-hydroxyproline epimerase [Alphaproteobacteria bacterium]|nr:4-hydroxyproline epimerase [Alphaproteobacteria bacterium]